jgi:hypothetical protein
VVPGPGTARQDAVDHAIETNSVRGATDGSWSKPTVKLGILRYSGIWNIDSLVEDVASAAAAGFSSYWIPNLASRSAT